jgi:hypothetical protein
MNNQNLTNVSKKSKHINFFILLFVFLSFYSCQKNLGIETSTPTLKNSAFETLKQQMTTTNFNDLDWINASIGQQTDSIALVKIQSKSDTSKTLFYGEVKGQKLYNWVQNKLVSTDGENYSGTLNIFSIENKLVKSYTVKNNKVVVTHHTNVVAVGAGGGDGGGDGMTLPDVTVTGYVNNVAITFICLYYAWAGSGVYPNSYNSYTPAYNLSHNGGIINPAAVVIVPLFNGSRTNNLQAIIKDYGDHKEITVTDNKTFLSANVTINFSVDKNNKLITGSQSLAVSGITPQWTQFTNQHPEELDVTNPPTISFTISGQLYIPAFFLNMTVHCDIIVNLSNGISSAYYDRGALDN